MDLSVNIEAQHSSASICGNNRGGSAGSVIFWMLTALMRFGIWQSRNAAKSGPEQNQREIPKFRIIEAER